MIFTGGRIKRRSERRLRRDPRLGLETWEERRRKVERGLLGVRW